MSVRHLLTAAADADAYALTGGRIASTVGGLLALAGVVIGGLALARPAGRNGRRGSIAALVSGSTATVIGAVVIAVADGGPGSGSGIVGGFVAVVLGLTAIVLGWLALARSRRASLVR
jgi:hypothetical protein